MPYYTEQNGNSGSSRVKWALVAFAIIGAYFLIAEHRAHVLPYLPWLILLACPLMHIFMHGGHGGHRGDHGEAKRPRGENGGASVAEPDGSPDGDAGRREENHSHHGGRR